MTYKQYLLSMFLLSMVGNVLCESQGEGQDKKQQSEEEIELSEIERERHKFERKLKVVNFNIKMMKQEQEHNKVCPGSFMPMEMGKLNSKLKEKANLLTEEIKSESEKLYQSLKSTAKIPLDKESYEGRERALQLYTHYVRMKLHGQTFKCLSDSENSVDDCMSLCQLIFSSFLSDKQVEELSFKLELFELEQRKKILEEELNKSN